MGLRNYFIGYGILLHELTVCGWTFQYTKYNIHSDLPTSNKCREICDFSHEVIPPTHSDLGSNQII